MAKAVAVASNTADATVLTGGVTLMAFTVISAAATKVYLRDGTSAAGPIVGVANVVGASGGTVTVAVPAVTCDTGLFVDRDGVASELVIYIGG